MKTAVATVKANKLSDWMYLHFIGDTHIGHVNHRADVLQEKINEIKENPQARWIGMGDYADHIYRKDKRFHWDYLKGDDLIAELKQGVMGQIRKVCSVLEPIKDQCIGLLSGNHEEYTYKEYEIDPVAEMVDRLKLDASLHLGYSGIILLHTEISYQNLRPITIFVHHGYGGGRTNGSQINKVEQMVGLCSSADIYAMGHTHGRSVTSKANIDISRPQKKHRIPTILKKTKAFVVTGCFVDTVTQGGFSFGEKQCFHETPVGSPTIKFRWTGHKIDRLVIRSEN